MEKKFIVKYVDNATKANVKKEFCFEDIFGTENISKISKYGIILATANFEKNGKTIRRRAFFRGGLSNDLMYCIMIASENSIWIEFGEKFEINLMKYSNIIFRDEMTSDWNIDNENELVNYYRETLPVFEYQRNFADVLAILVSYSDYWDKIQYCIKYNDTSKIEIDKSYFKKQSNALYTISTGYIAATVQDCKAIRMLFKNYSGRYNIIIGNDKLTVSLKDSWPDTIGGGQNLLTILILTMFMGYGAFWWEK